MAIDFNQNYFQLFDIECSTSINHNLLEKKYLEFQKEFHPDRFVNASDYEKRISLQITSHVNKAYETLKNDYLKNIYLLKMKGYEIEDENNTISDPEFLTHQMELREEVEDVMETWDDKISKELFLRISNYKKNYLKEFKDNYNNNLLQEASKNIMKIKFYMSIESDFKRNVE